VASLRTTLNTRSSGLLMHLTSLPGPHGIGDLGHESHRFADLLAAAGQRWWQMLPVGPAGAGNSPYDSPSSFAGNPLLISLEELVYDGLLSARDIANPPSFRGDRVDYALVRKFKEPLLEKACAHLLHGKGDGHLREGFEKFRESHKDWLNAYALFTVAKELSGHKAWHSWTPELIEKARKESLLEPVRAAQYLFHRQFSALRNHCRKKGIELLGDVPIFVAMESADVWSHPEIFHLDKHGRPTVVSGVPPDYFSETGQLWGTPLYRWDILKEQGYAWWLSRLRQAAERFDAVRLDHFIGFCRYWEIPAGEKTAIKGRWVPGPGADFFDAVAKHVKKLELVAEDLGAVSPEIFALRDQFGLPGMSVIEFGFEDLPPNRVIYTGTHDNDTAVGWWKSLTDKERHDVRVKLSTDASEIHWDLIGYGMRSPASTAIFPVQDLLGLDTRCRMNLPGTTKGNWQWRLLPGALNPDVVSRFRELTSGSGRLRA
jgi:4-alpha-glucanotransferase